MKAVAIRVAAIIAVAGSIVSSAHAQTAWANPVDGTWGTAANWTLGLPNSSVDATVSVAGTYAITASGVSAARDLTISNALASVQLPGGGTQTLSGSLSNAGVLTINSNGIASNAALIFAAANPSITGTGSIVINAVGSLNDASLQTTVATNVITQGAGHTITGRGQVYAALINNGLVSATGATGLLQLITNPKTNTSLFLAQGGGLFDLENVVLTQTGAGTTRADGAGSVVQAHGTITGGVVEAINGGVVRTGGVLTLDNVDLNGPSEVVAGTTLAVVNGLTNTGTITVNPSGSATDAVVTFNSVAQTLDGAGSIVLNGTSSIADAYLTGTPTTNVLTQAAAHTITGTGIVHVALTNNGVVRADGAGKTVQLATTAKVNNNLYVAQNAGTIDVEGVVVTQTGGGTIRATGANSIAQVHGSILGGVVEGVSGGVVRTGGALTLDDVDLNGASEVTSGTTLTVLTGLTNTGTMTVNPTGSAADAVVTFNSPVMTLDGNGTISLGGVSSTADAFLTSAPSTNAVTQAAGHTITGNGQVRMALTNNGIVRADGAGKTVQLTTTAKTNNNLYVAQNGGTVDIELITVTQSASGVIRATGANSIAEVSGAVSGGVLEGVSGGSVRVAADTTFTSVQLNGDATVQPSATLSLDGTFTNNAMITVNPAASATNAAIRFMNADTTLVGTGTIMLNGISSLNDANLSGAVATNAFSNGTGHTLAGSGQVLLKCTNQGTINPGHGVGGDQTQQIQFSGTNADLVCAASSVIRIDVEGATAADYDTLSGVLGADFTCAGSLQVNHLGAYTGPAFGTFLDVITMSSVTGTFGTVNAPALPNQGRYVVIYTPTQVRLYATCYANCDGSTTAPVLNALDFGCFLTNFAAGDPVANCDQSSTAPVLNALDFGCFLTKFAGGCN